MVWICGRACKLGWEYNKSLCRLVPVGEQVFNIISKAKNEWSYIVFDLSSTDVNYLVSFIFLN